MPKDFGSSSESSEWHSDIGKGSRGPRDVDRPICRLSRDEARAQDPSVVFLVLVLLRSVHLGPKSS